MNPLGLDREAGHNYIVSHSLAVNLELRADGTEQNDWNWDASLELEGGSWEKKGKHKKTYDNAK